MLFEYVAPGLSVASQPPNAGTVWSPFPLQPFTPGTLTPFSYSVLAELTSRAWYLYYDRLGFDPTPRSRVVRRHKGRVYFNLSLSAQMESLHAAVEPPTLHLNGEQHALAEWEKPGFLAGFKTGRAQKKIDDTLVDYARQIQAITEKARAWYLKTQAIKRWGQAEVLQIMEEIERVGVESMVAFLAARLNLGQHYGRLASQLSGDATTGHSTAQAMLAINHALCDISGLVETEMLKTLSGPASALREPAALAWLQAGNFANWRAELPIPAADQIKNFLDAYGHRAVQEGEIAVPRWTEDASWLLAALLAHAEESSQLATPAASKNVASQDNAQQNNAQQLLAMLPSAARKQGEQSLKKIAELHQLQSSALHSLAYIWAGTRNWAMAAAREAMVDKRLHNEDEVFLFEIEEIKQMMTGEWNISSLDEIRALTATRRAEQATLQGETPPDILVDDHEAFATHSGVGAVAGRTNAPLARWQTSELQEIRGVVVAANLLDSGCVLALPFAHGFVAAAGSVCDPFVAAAHAWQRPVVVGLGKSYDDLKNGAPTTVEVSADTVTVSQA